MFLNVYLIEKSAEFHLSEQRRVREHTHLVRLACRYRAPQQRTYQLLLCRIDALRRLAARVRNTQWRIDTELNKGGYKERG